MEPQEILRNDHRFTGTSRAQVRDHPFRSALAGAQGRDLPYRTSSLDEIAAIHRKALALAAPRFNFLMWATDKFLLDGEAMMRGLGLALHARFIWDKGNGPCPAFTVRFTHEYLLWFYPKGQMLKPIPSMRGAFATVMREAPREHSRKPEASFQMIGAMFPSAAKLELFSRCERAGWDSWGDQAGLFGQAN